MKHSSSHCIPILALLLNGGQADASENLNTNPRKEYANANPKPKASNTIKGTETGQVENQRDLQYSVDVPRKQPAVQTSGKETQKMLHESKWEQTVWQYALLSPTEAPSEIPSATSAPSDMPSSMPTKIESANLALTYIPGKLNNYQNGVLLSEGLQSRIVATSMEKVEFADGTFSSFGFHTSPDGAGVFADPDTGGWSYISNSERENGDGGVGAIVFNADGGVVGYKHLQQGTSWNCSGGKTPWNTWISCEEIDNGRIWQIDPSGLRPPEETSISAPGTLGKFESFAYYIQDFDKPHFYVTEDNSYGALRRFTPSNPNWQDPWSILHGEGALEYLVMLPSSGDRWDDEGTYYWTDDHDAAKANARSFYTHTEGMDVYGTELFVTSKVQYSLFVLDLEGNTYKRFSTAVGLFDGQPDQVTRLIKNDNVQTSSTFDANEAEEEPLLYFCEEKGDSNGIHARDANGWYYTILESSEYGRETTGLAFSPDGKHMYFSFQARGVIFDVWREDGLPFYGKTLDVHYHQQPDDDDASEARSGRDMWS